MSFGITYTSSGYMVVHLLSKEPDIVLINRKPVTYYDCSYYDTALTEKGDYWHQILIHHDSKYSKKNIVRALYEAVSDSEFYPVAYRRGRVEDFFLIRLCHGAIAKLFKKNLVLKMLDGKFLHLTMKVNVAEYNLDHISPNKKLAEVINSRAQNLKVIENVTKVLDLDNLASCPELEEIIFNFGNRAVLALLCEVLACSTEVLSSINGIRLSNNNIETLLPFFNLPAINLQLIDIRSNNIRTAQQLSHFRKIQFSELFIDKNPLANKKDYIDEIQHMYPLLTRINGVYIKKPQTSADMATNAIEVAYQGDIITGNDSYDIALFRKYKSSTMWHQVIINHCGKYNKTQLINALFKIITTHEFYPCYYHSGRDRDNFFVFNCHEQLETIYISRLVLKMPPHDDIVKITLKMNVSNFKPGQIDPNEKINSAIGQRFNLVDKCLNLKDFASSPELSNIVVPLSCPRILAHILLTSARRYLGNITKLILSNNELITTEGTHPLTWMKGLKLIDLSNNQIENIPDFSSLPSLTVVEVMLAGNPVVKKFESSVDYVREMKKIFPEMETLDGESISADGYCIAQQNYLCSLEGYDFIEQFINQYFTMFDSISRGNLKGLYDQEAVLTMSTNYTRIPGPHAKQLKTYTDKSRNVLKMTNFGHAMSTVFIGAEQIVDIWKSIEATEHDYKSFMIDLIYYSVDMVVFTINGIYKELGALLNDDELMLGFVKTFVLKPTAKNVGLFGRSSEYKICNEQVLIYKPSMNQFRNSFKYNNRVMDISNEELSPEDREGMLIIFQELSSLTPSWSLRCLEQSAWNFRAALELFIHLTEENKIPSAAYNLALPEAIKKMF